jgi:hypothetical protein
MSDAKRTRWFRPRFGLSTLLLLVLLVAVSLAWWRDRQVAKRPEKRTDAFVATGQGDWIQQQLESLHGRGDVEVLVYTHPVFVPAIGAPDAARAKVFFVECSRQEKASGKSVPFTPEEADAAGERIRQALVKRLEAVDAQVVRRSSGPDLWQADYETADVLGAAAVRWNLDRRGRIVLVVMIQEEGKRVPGTEYIAD